MDPAVWLPFLGPFGCAWEAEDGDEGEGEETGSREGFMRVLDGEDRAYESWSW